MTAKLTVLTAASLLLSSGCAVAPLANRVSKFGAAAFTIAKGSSDAYNAVERANYNAQVSSLVLDFDTKGFDTAKLQPFLSGEDREARRALLKCLQRYAALLEDVAGTRSTAQLNSAVSDFGQELNTLATNPTLNKLANVNPSEVKLLTSVIAAAGQFALERQRRKVLGPILKNMQPVVDRICAVLTADLGKGPGADGAGARGLRLQLWDGYDTLITNQKLFILRNKSTLTPLEKAAEIARLPALVKAQSAGDDALAATQTALADLASTHRALLADSQIPGTFARHLAEMKNNGQRIADFYNNLSFN